MRKKGIATGLTWMIAILVIVFAATLFIFAVLALVANDKILGSEDSPIEISRDSGSNIILEKNFNSFLNRKIEFKGEEITILELIETNQIERGQASDLFIREAKKQFEVTLPFPTSEWDNIVYKFDPDHLSGGSGQPVSIHPYWLKVLGISEEIISDHNHIFAMGGTDCKPFTEGITLTRYTKDKKIILCVNKDYYRALEGRK